jgi:hypothetical protein
MNPARLLVPSTYRDAASEVAELVNLLRDLPRHIDTLAESSKRLAQAAETLAAVVEPLVFMQERIERPLGQAADRVRKSRAAMTELRTATAPRRKPTKPDDGAATPARPARAPRRSPGETR